MTRKAREFFSLKRPKVRASWNPRNLYNLARLRKQMTVGGRTFYQLKYEAKQLTRAYHGEQIREGKWERMFSRYLPAVVEMNARQLAVQDGEEEAAGRGAGRDASSEDAKTQETPYMQMTYWVNERRLDTAIFRSLFASSLRQARQMVVHGHVKVNGKKFTHPSYLLNPGDMFSVDPDMVLFATSNTGVAAQQSAKNKPKKQPQSALSDEAKDTESASAATAAEPDADDDLDPDWSALPPQPADADADADTEADLDLPAQRRTGPPQQLDPAIIKARRATLKELYDLTRQTDAQQTPAPAPKQKQALRAMRSRLRVYVAKPWRLSEQDIDDVAGELETLLVAIEAKGAAAAAAAATADADAAVADMAAADDDVLELEQREGQRPRAKSKTGKAGGAEAARVNEHLQALARVAGEWEPKDYMAPFAFIPRYLEVNHTVCSGVYLRHPVARMGQAEVPTPFPLETGNLAFTYYLRRR